MRFWPAKARIVVVVVTCVQRTESPRDKLKRLPFGTVNRTGGGKNLNKLVIADEERNNNNNKANFLLSRVRTRRC